jgi:hypothetical protein
MALSSAEKQRRYRERQSAQHGAMIAGLRALARELKAEGHPALGGRIERLLNGEGGNVTAKAAEIATRAAPIVTLPPPLPKEPIAASPGKPAVTLPETSDLDSLQVSARALFQKTGNRSDAPEWTELDRQLRIAKPLVWATVGPKPERPDRVAGWKKKREAAWDKWMRAVHFTGTRLEKAARKMTAEHEGR